MTEPVNPRAREVVDFWFGPPGDPARASDRKSWWTKDDSFDAEIEERFAPLVAEALSGGLAEWEEHPADSLALLLLLDQFPRNIHRNTPAAFAGDVRARAVAGRVIEAGGDRSYPSIWKRFFYLPFQHSERIEDQRRCLELAAALPDAAEKDGFLDFSQRHHDIIRRFGRFPHRNAALGRESTPEELDFLTQPGSSF